MMRRALGLAAMGMGRTSPNPMVGAVITARGRIIGEGFHRAWGEPHAEVNAVRSVAPADLPLLREATIYVTLEPCSHYGKTPPCSQLIIDKGIPRVVVAAVDPFPEVAGRGIEMLRRAGCSVTTGLLAPEARLLNRRFFTAHLLHRPYIQLKWACTADGFIAPPQGEPRLHISTPLTQTLMHRERSLADAILVGPRTVALDRPSLTCRRWPGRNPRRASLFTARPLADANGASLADGYLLQRQGESLVSFMERMYAEEKITSLMVEGGKATLEAFLREGLFDEIHIETAPWTLNPDRHGAVRQPAIPPDAPLALLSSETVDGSLITVRINRSNPVFMEKPEGCEQR